MTDSNWKPFWWESNRTWGKIESPEDWQHVVDCFEKDDSVDGLGKAKECHFGHGSLPCMIPKFGFSIECSEDKTLKEWADENGMTLFGVNDGKILESS